MKLLPLLLAGVFFTAVAPRVAAIPQSVGGLFLNASGNPRHLPIEDWFKEAGHWQLSKLPQVPWIMGTDSTGRMLNDPGQVFGFAADNVVVNNSETGPEITSVAVQFSAEKTKVPRSDLLKRLSRTVATFTGAAEQKLTDGGLSFAGKEYTVVLKEWKSGAVIATLKR
ncbi:hypothetical protein DES53_11453 [Roseimicrobium gellanilyticum]|uniref:Uncharacterized protein n=1 Tax=Roseimicrobium gellanilyticum TaxID=748857 RepID=A0A366H735_9BACT|nr:hypothetical protein [Roseimicrobium gellanilyticum]RBP37315.1 hypothetical protein DES53_11453 [Roseimicrobium gellanilyticum]